MDREKLNLGRVMPSFLVGYAQVVCKNAWQKHCVLEWAKQNGKSIGGLMGLTCYPLHLFLQGEIVGWTDSPDRIGDKISFLEFIEQSSNN